MLVQDLRDAASLVGVLAFCTGATAYYYVVFYRSRLVPRWLSAWGLAGTALGLIAALLVLFREIGMLSRPARTASVADPPEPVSLSGRRRCRRSR